MSWYKDSSRLVPVNGTGAHRTTIYGPADKVPVSRIYLCVGCKKEITSNEGDPLLPQNDHQHGSEQGAVRWKLIVRTNTKGE